MKRGKLCSLNSKQRISRWFKIKVNELTFKWMERY